MDINFDYIILEIKTLVEVCNDNCFDINTRNKLKFELIKIKEEIDKLIIQYS